MATSQQGIDPVSVIAGAAVSRYRFVQLQTDGKFDQVGTAQTRADGIACDAASGDGVTFPMATPSGRLEKVEAGAACTVGAQVASDNQGRAIPHVTTAGNYILGVFLTAASAAGEIVEILFSVHQDGA